MKKLLTLLLTLVMAVCLAGLKATTAKAQDKNEEPEYVDYGLIVDCESGVLRKYYVDGTVGDEWIEGKDMYEMISTRAFPTSTTGDDEHIYDVVLKLKNFKFYTTCNNGIMFPAHSKKIEGDVYIGVATNITIVLEGENTLFLKPSDNTTSVVGISLGGGLQSTSYKEEDVFKQEIKGSDNTTNNSLEIILKGPETTPSTINSYGLYMCDANSLKKYTFSIHDCNIEVDSDYGGIYYDPTAGGDKAEIGNNSSIKKTNVNIRSKKIGISAVNTTIRNNTNLSITTTGKNTDSTISCNSLINICDNASVKLINQNGKYGIGFDTAFLKFIDTSNPGGIPNPIIELYGNESGYHATSCSKNPMEVKLANQIGKANGSSDYETVSFIYESTFSPGENIPSYFKTASGSKAKYVLLSGTVSPTKITSNRDKTIHMRKGNSTSIDLLFEPFNAVGDVKASFSNPNIVNVNTDKLIAGKVELTSLNAGKTTMTLTSAINPNVSISFDIEVSDAPTPTIVKTNNYILGSEKETAVVSNDELSNFIDEDTHKLKTNNKVEVAPEDGNYTTLVYEQDYKATEGSIKILLQPSYLETLEEGTYNIKVTSDGGEAIGTFKVKKQVTPTPDPGKKDESCEKVIGPTWHWNNSKGVCEEVSVVGTSTR